MRADAIYDLLVARFEALTIDGAVSVSDVLTHDPQTADEARPEMSFVLEQGQLSPSDTMTTLTPLAYFRARFYLIDGPLVRQRITSLGERVLVSLVTFVGGPSTDLDIIGVVKLGDWIPARAEGVEGLITCSIDFAVKYRLTGVS